MNVKQSSALLILIEGIFMNNKFEYKLYYKRNLPHYQPCGSYIFVTYRLAFSLPKKIIDELNQQKEKFKIELKKYPVEKQKKIQIDYSKKIFVLEDNFLDKYTDSHMWLKQDNIAQMTMDSLLFFHNKKYILICAVIMSNHVHILIKPMKKNDNDFYSIAEIIKNHKSFTATQANKILKRSGKFWHHESYDHFIRDEKEYYRVIEYILNNPVNAGLIKEYF